MSKALIKAADVDDEGAVGVDFTEGPKVINHLLVVVALLGDGGVSLEKVVEHCLKLDGLCLPVLEKLGLDSELGLPSGGALGGDDFSKVIGQSAEDPRLHHTVHPCLVRRVDWSIKMNVILERELAKGQ